LYSSIEGIATPCRSILSRIILSEELVNYHSLVVIDFACTTPLQYRTWRAFSSFWSSPLGLHTGQTGQRL
jgi:hypothetical protein